MNFSEPSSKQRDQSDPWHGHPAWPSVQRVILLLRVGSFLYLALTVYAYVSVLGYLTYSVLLWLPFPFQILVLVYLTCGCGSSLVADAIVSSALRKKKSWAWIAALVVFALDASSLILLPISIMGLKILASAEMRGAFDENV